MRKKDDTLRDTLLNSAQSIADTEGIEAVNIRSIAKKAGIASGTVYNYFSNKDEILLALTEEYWKQTLQEMKTEITADSFCGQLQQIFYYLKERIDQSAGKLMNSLGNVEMAGQANMASMQSVLETALIRSMEQDADIRKDVWDETFTKEQFARFIMMNMMMLLKTHAPDITFFIRIIKRTIYQYSEYDR
ncbi:TetR/AcrR family transcriptional regulator [Blautia schinkii]|nr:TetR/AcrR family transcriptional regulator [Blautia schinkii]